MSDSMSAYYEAIVIEYTEPPVVAGDHFTAGMHRRGMVFEGPPGMKFKVVLTVKTLDRAIEIARILNTDYFS